MNPAVLAFGALGAAVAAYLLAVVAQAVLPAPPQAAGPFAPAGQWLSGLYSLLTDPGAMVALVAAAALVATAFLLRGQ